MNFIILMGVLTVSTIGGFLVPECLDQHATLYTCFSDHGFSVADMHNLVSRITGITEEDLRQQCQQLPRYQDIWRCILREYYKCPYEVPIIINQSIEQMTTFCDDTNNKSDSKGHRYRKSVFGWPAFSDLYSRPATSKEDSKASKESEWSSWLPAAFWGWF